MTMRLGLLGASGRMGKQVSALVMGEYAPHFQLIATPSRSEPFKPLLNTDVIIDFSLPQASVALIELCLQAPLEQKLPSLVIGSTGWNKEQLQALDQIKTKTAVFMASNFSVGVFLLQRILEQFSPVFENWGYQASMTEIHHVHKKDAPSGTAKTLAAAIHPEQPESVQIQSVREGEVIGEHSILFKGRSDQLTLSHSARDRSLFARGALEAAKWIALRKQSDASLTGLFGMKDLVR